MPQIARSSFVNKNVSCLLRKRAALAKSDSKIRKEIISFSFQFSFIDFESLLIMIRFTTRLWNGYLKVLDKAPWKVQIIQTGKVHFVKRFFQDLEKFQYLGTLMASGDLIAQCWLEQVPVQKIDWARTARFGIIGCIFVVSYIL